MSKEQLVFVEPKTDAGKTKLSYHGNKWILRGKEIPKFQRNRVMCLVLLSRDGTKIIFVAESDDPDFVYRML